MAKSDTETLLADNRKAGHDYHILDTFEAGVMLVGTEVKAIREGRINLRDSYCKFEGAEAFLLNVHIGQYSHGGYASHEPTRKRKLLLHRAQLSKLLGKTTIKGLTKFGDRRQGTDRNRAAIDWIEAQDKHQSQD